MSSSASLVVLLLCLLQSSWIRAVSIQEKENAILKTVLGNYDPSLRPIDPAANDTGIAPTIVNVNMFIRKIGALDEQHMTYDIQVTLRQEWLDDRLKYENKAVPYLTINDPSKLWIPDLFISNEMEARTHDILVPNTYLRIFPEGNVLYSTRLSMTLSCPMNLRLFPMDSQTCSIRMASYGYTTDHIVFLWKDGDPLQVVKNLHMPLFTLEKFDTGYCTSKTNTGEYSCIKADLLFHRDFNYYLLNFFIPSVMLVVLSWVSFWLDNGAITSRMLLGISTLLALAVHSCHFNDSNAAVSYSRASDVWSGVCLAFVFASILETASVHYCSRREARSKSGKEAPPESVEAPPADEEAMKPLVDQPEEVVAKDAETGSPSKYRLKERVSGLKTRIADLRCCKKLDILSRIFFPVVFVLFAVVYCIAYHTAS